MPGATLLGDVGVRPPDTHGRAPWNLSKRQRLAVGGILANIKTMTMDLGTTLMAARQAQVVDLTPAAVARARELLANHGADAAGIRLGVKTTGCSGMSYKLDFAQVIGAEDTVIEQDGVKLVVEPGAIMYVLGTRIDWVEDKLGAMFVFDNPNEKARCGCGESFSV